MAFLALSSAWSINEGIGVDTHVHRITNRLGWHDPPTTEPEKTRLNLQSWLPKEYVDNSLHYIRLSQPEISCESLPSLHQEINHMLVGFGQVNSFPLYSF